MVRESAVFFPRKYWAAASQTMAGKVLVVGPERANHNQARQARPTPSGLGWTAYALLRLPLLAALYENLNMDVSKYYDKAKEVGELAKTQAPSILTALDYSPDDDHPSSWVPKVQKSLLDFYKEFPGSEVANKALNLYIQGAILEDRAERNMAVKVGFGCLILGVVIGWFVWA
ncbi:hypothetical protein ACJJIK_02160 [Microbulbifer sp. ZKSA006]|uniref:hypothetical protein n=1 Tax=Microbulbifer sp. ZKSA006 TaxID=3243390 RepID=UPI0040398FAD